MICRLCLLAIAAVELSACAFWGMSDWSDNSTGESLVARDRFERTESGSLGASEVGGPWTLGGRVDEVSVADGAAHLPARVAETLTAVLHEVSALDVDATVSITVPEAPDGNGVYLSLIARVMDDAGDLGYRLSVNVDEGGQVTQSLKALDEAPLDNGVVTFGAAYTPGAIVRLRMQVEGESPTRLRGRVWLGAEPEPEVWAIEADDSTAELQSAGGLGLTVYTSSTATRSGDFTFDELEATPVEPAE